MSASAPPLASLFTAVNDSVRSAVKSRHLFWSPQLEKASCAIWHLQVYRWPSSKVTWTPFKVVKLLLGCSPFYRIRYWPCTAENTLASPSAPEKSLSTRTRLSKVQFKENRTLKTEISNRASLSYRVCLIRTTWLHVIEHYEEEKEEEC